MVARLWRPLRNVFYKINNTTVRQSATSLCSAPCRLPGSLKTSTGQPAAAWLVGGLRGCVFVRKCVRAPQASVGGLKRAHACSRSADTRKAGPRHGVCDRGAACCTPAHKGSPVTGLQTPSLPGWVEHTKALTRAAAAQVPASHLDGLRPRPLPAPPHASCRLHTLNSPPRPSSLPLFSTHQTNQHVWQG